jgi:catalase
LRWHLIVIIGQPGDPTNDATAVWPADRKRLDVGTLTLDRAQSEESSPATNITFDPLVLPEGISPSDDPLLSPRSAVYAESFARRAGEKKLPSAITPAEVGKGE